MFDRLKSKLAKPTNQDGPSCVTIDATSPVIDLVEMALLRLLLSPSSSGEKYNGAKVRGGGNFWGKFCACFNKMKYKVVPTSGLASSSDAQDATIAATNAQDATIAATNAETKLQILWKWEESVKEELTSLSLRQDTVKNLLRPLESLRTQDRTAVDICLVDLLRSELEILHLQIKIKKLISDMLKSNKTDRKPFAQMQKEARILTKSSNTLVKSMSNAKKLVIRCGEDPVAKIGLGS